MNTSLKNLHDAEDFFRFFQVPYDQKIVSISRIHILKRFRIYLDRDQMLDADPKDSQVWEKQRCLFLQAYQDFTHSNPLAVPVFQQSKCSSCLTGCNS